MYGHIGQQLHVRAHWSTMQCMGRDNRLECHSLAWGPTLPSQYSRHIVHIEQIVQIVHIAHIVHIVQIVYCALCSLWQKPTNEGGKRLEPVELWHKFAYLKALHCSQYHYRKFTKCKKVCHYLKTWPKVCLLPIKLHSIEYLKHSQPMQILHFPKFSSLLWFFHCWTGWRVGPDCFQWMHSVLNFWKVLSDIKTILCSS